MLSELKHTCFKTLKGFCTPYPRTRILSLFCDEKRKNSRQERETRFFNIRNQGFRTFLNGGSGVSPDNSNNSNSVFFFFGSLFLFASQSKRKSEQYHVKFLKIDNTSALIYNFYTCSNNKKGVRNGSTV